MNRYFKLVHMEVHRFRWVLAILMAIVAITQFASLIWATTKELSFREKLLLETVDKSLLGGFSPQYLSFEWAIFSSQMGYILPMFLCMGVLALYVFVIWYRDWFGRSTFVYRLLMLPTARRNLYLAKISAFLLFVLAFISFQLLLLKVQHIVFNLIVPADQRIDSHIVEAIISNQALVWLIPQQFEQFVYLYGFGAIVVVAVFTAILLERSYRRLGILYGVLYLAGCVFVVAAPFLFLYMDQYYSYLYPYEIFALGLTLCILVLGISVWLGMRLMAKKITV
ncbi:hypothetical protein AB4Z45_07565 [Paenibacillus sp. MCAF9]|uniref:hypothetical protein n=1 Tax=Paenibacillus sp. MCAF9 TaxID=3233046 RepID=UPI003F9DE322